MSPTLGDYLDRKLTHDHLLTIKCASPKFVGLYALSSNTACLVDPIIMFLHLVASAALCTRTLDMRRFALSAAELRLSPLQILCLLVE